VAGTHGKTTTTAMTVWLLSQLKVPQSYILPAKTSFAEMGHFDPTSQFFVYECDEFDRNFLAFEPYLSLLTGVSWDHHEIFKTRGEYQQAFRDFLAQSKHGLLWQTDADYLDLPANDGLSVLADDAGNDLVTLKGAANRRDAWLAVETMRQATGTPLEDLIKFINEFPGLTRRMEPIAPGLYSDYAHTPEKIRGAMSAALEIAAANKQKLVVVYEPLTNRRQHFMIDDYKDCFAGAASVYWTPSYLAREDPDQAILKPEELISHLADPSIAQPAELDDKLKQTLIKHLQNGDMVVGMAGGGGGSLDEWLRKEFV
jgi:UDP-N-acetylmuramate--alanine ligase